MIRKRDRVQGVFGGGHLGDLPGPVLEAQPPDDQGHRGDALDTARPRSKARSPKTSAVNSGSTTANSRPPSKPVPPPPAVDAAFAPGQRRAPGSASCWAAPASASSRPARSSAWPVCTPA
ncbi:MAG: hypothetical protein MZV70_15185 [Desulfobacterales bacterium]|nr:hypothetical protein [Desulfobacterales bacterium]